MLPMDSLYPRGTIHMGDRRQRKGGTNPVCEQHKRAWTKRFEMVCCILGEYGRRERPKLLPQFDQKIDLVSHPFWPGVGENRTRPECAGAEFRPSVEPAYDMTIIKTASDLVDQPLLVVPAVDRLQSRPFDDTGY